METFMGFEGRQFMNGGLRLPYRFFKPIGYDPQKKYPLVLLLHGGGEKGTDNYAPISHGIGLTGPGTIFTTTESQAKWPVFLAAPQSADGFWTGAAADAAVKLVAALQTEFPSIDAQRLYITGLSLGGTGAWAIALQYPTMFAATVPMAGMADVGQAARIAKVPLWDFHSAMDEITNVSASRRMIAAMKAAGGKPCYTEYPDGAHRTTFLRSYQNPDLLPWMYAQRAGMPDQYGCVVSAGGTIPNAVDGGARDVGGGGGMITDAGSPDAPSGGGSGGASGGTGGISGTGGSGTGGSAGAGTGSGGVGGGPPPVDAGPALGADAGATGGTTTGVTSGGASGCGCAVVDSPATTSSLVYLFLLASLVLMRRRSPARERLGTLPRSRT
jgi:MYXO-CTERM domain-containing protein